MCKTQMLKLPRYIQQSWWLPAVGDKKRQVHQTQELGPVWLVLELRGYSVAEVSIAGHLSRGPVYGWFWNCQNNLKAKPMKICSVSLICQEKCKSKLQRDVTSHWSERPLSKSSDIEGAGEGGGRGTLLHCWWNGVACSNYRDHDGGSL